MIGTGLINLIQSRMMQRRIDSLFPPMASPALQQSEQTRRIDEFAKFQSDTLNTDRTTASMDHP